MTTSDTTQKPTEFDNVLRLLRLGLAKSEQDHEKLLRIGAFNTAAEALVQLEADRLLVMGWICAAEFIEQDLVADDRIGHGYSNFR